MDLGGHMADLTRNPPDVAASGPIHGRRQSLTGTQGAADDLRLDALQHQLVGTNTRHRRPLFGPPAVDGPRGSHVWRIPGQVGHVTPKVHQKISAESSAVEDLTTNVN